MGVTYAIGDKVRLTKDIWEDQCDGLIPGHYLGSQGEELVVKKGMDKFSECDRVGVAHQNRTDDAYFVVTLDEIESV